jgi:hypothetical protein
LTKESEEIRDAKIKKMADKQEKADAKREAE